LYKYVHKKVKRTRPKNSFSNPTEGPLSKKAIYELFLLSTFIFILSALLVQFLMNFQTAILLRHYSISFTYSLFSINFSSFSTAKWTLFRIYIVFGLSSLEFFIAGIMLLFIKVKNWKVKLILTWLAFLMIHVLPLGLLSGIFIYDGFGIAYIWLFQSIMVRILISLTALLITIFFRQFWIYRFLKTVYSRKYLDNDFYRTKYIKYCFILPWFAGVIILSAFALPHHTWNWLVFIFGLACVILPIFKKKVPFHKILIYKSDKKILPLRYPLIYFITIIGVIWLGSLIKIYF